MSEGLPIIVGFGLIALVIGAARVFPRSWIGGELWQSYGARPRGPYRTLTRKDHLRRAAYSLLAALALVGSATALYPLTERFPNLSRPRFALEAIFFTAFILGAVAAFAAILALAAAAFWRPKRLKSTEAGRLDLAEYLTALGAGRIAYEHWLDFSAVRFEDEEIEAMRRTLASRIGAVPRELSDDDIEWLQRSADRLLPGRSTNA